MKDDSTQPVATAVANLQRSLPSRTTNPSPVTSPLTVPSPTKSPGSPSLRILVVEDNLVNQKVLAKQLQKASCIVQVANHGGEALQFLQNTVYWTGHPSAATQGLELDVILMDMEMPVMDGITCARAIREMQIDGKLRGHVPIIAVTANAREKQIEQALESGMVCRRFRITNFRWANICDFQDDFVSKPFRIAELLPKVRSLIARLALEQKTSSSNQK